MSNDWSVVGTLAKYQNIDETSTTQNHKLGTRVRAWHDTYGEGEFIYLKGVGSTIATDWVTFNTDDFSTVRLVADADGPVAVAKSACVASNYGWYQIYGKTLGGSGGAIVDGAKIYAHGTAGLVDDAVVDGDLVHNALCRSTISGPSITGEFQIAYPYCDNIAGND